MGFRVCLFYSISLRFPLCKMSQLDLDKWFFTIFVNQNYMEDMFKNTVSWLPTTGNFLQFNRFRVGPRNLYL